MNWTEKVRQIQRKGYTQQEIANYVGCSQSYIGLIATGSRGGRISFSIAQRIIEMLEKMPDKS
ncbi:helix-turn-helix domain-containing protein [Neisseria sp.]